jgi:methyltransferase-like protein
MTPLSEKPSIISNEVERFKAPTGTVVSSSNPINKAAICYLGEIWPNAVRFGELLDESRAQAHSTTAIESDAQILGDTLLKSLAVDLIEIQLNAPRFTTEISSCPRVSALVRWQAVHDERVTNQRHEAIEVDGLMRAILTKLDGSHGRSELIQELSSLLQPENGDGATAESVLESELHDIARAALLLA